MGGNTIPRIVFTLAAVGGAYVVGKWYLNSKYRDQASIDLAKLQQSVYVSELDTNNFGSAEECLEETPASQSERQVASDIAKETDESKSKHPRPLAAIRVDRSKRIKKAKASKFVCYLVDSAKAEFGLPRPTAANRLMVQGYLNRLCKEWGLVNKDTHQAVSVAIPMVFVPTDADIIATAIESTEFTRTKCGQHARVQAEGWWNNLLGIGGHRGLRFTNK